MNKIKKVSRFFRVLFQFLFVLFPIAFVVFWINAPAPFGFPQLGIYATMLPESVHVMHILSPSEKMIGALISSVPLIIEELILYFLISLFALYEKGEIFTLNNVRYIKNIGYALLATQIVHPFYEFLMGVAMTIHNPHGHRMAAITIDHTNIGIVLMALMTILISWIMAEGCKLHEEQQYTV